MNLKNLLIEKERIIRMEMNVIEFPIFSKSRTTKKGEGYTHIICKEKSEYLEINPSENKSIPGEFEEKVYLSLLNIFKENDYQKIFYCTGAQILNNISNSEGAKKSLYKRVKEAMEKLTETIYTFHNIYYDNSKNNKVRGVIKLSLINTEIIKCDEVSEEEKHLFKDKRTKELYKVEISDEMYNNLVRKGYVAYDLDKLLSIKDSTTRALYLKITKWRNYKLCIEKNGFDIAQSLPLCMEYHSIKNTMKKISNSLEELKELGEIEDFKTINKRIGRRKVCFTEFEIMFNEKNNKEKKETFYLDRDNFKKVFKSIVEQIKEAKDRKRVTNLDLEEIIKVFGEKGKNLNTLYKAVEEALKEYDFDYVKYAAEYAIIYSKQSLSKYFKDTLKNNWHEEYTAKEIEKEKRKQKVKEKEQQLKKIEEAVVVEAPKSTFSKEEFEKLSLEDQKELDKRTYEFYLKNSGAKDSKFIRGIYEKSKYGIMSKNFPELIAKFQKEAEGIKLHEPEKMDVEAFLDEGEVLADKINNNCKECIA